MSTVVGTGAMLVVGASATEIEQWMADQCSDVVIAVVNSPNSTVISGPADHIERAEQNLDAAGYFVCRVAVNVASHSPQMSLLAELLSADLTDLSPQPTEIEFFSTVVSGNLAGPDLGAEYWASNLRNRFRFADAIVDIASDQPTAFVEISPHPLLSSAIRENNSDSVVVSSTARNQPERYEILRNLALLYPAGVDVDFAGLYESGLCVPMPRYAWQRERFWLDDAFEAPHPGPAGAVLSSRLGSRHSAVPGRARPAGISDDLWDCHDRTCSTSNDFGSRNRRCDGTERTPPAASSVS